MTTDMSKAMQVLLAKQEIVEALHRYCRGVDRADEALIASAYHADSTDDRGWWIGSGPDFAAFVAADMRRSGRRATHMMMNVLPVVRGVTAFVESYIFATLMINEKGVETCQQMGGRYLDRFECRDGVWAIAHRKVVCDWRRVEEVGDQPPFLRPAAEQHAGALGEDDPSYALFAGRQS